MRTTMIIVNLVFAVSFGFAQSGEEIFTRAENEFVSGNYTEAAQLYSQVIAMNAENMNAYLRRGFCFSVQKQYDKAIEDFSYVIQQHENHPFAYISRGSAYSKMEKFETAILDFDKALLLDPTSQEAYNNRGWAKTGLGLTKEACADWKKSKKLGNQEAKLILKNNHCK